MENNDNNNRNTELATFAGGCFWCMVSPFDDLDGVLNVKSGYTGGLREDATYKAVCTGKTGHYEAVQITFDPSRTSYRQLLDIFWKQIDPTDPGGQFYDRGQQYETAIFYHNEEQRQEAEESMRHIEASGRFNKPVATKILKACDFYPAEEYHQDYHKKNPDHYKRYKAGSGREAFIENVWEGEVKYE